MLDPATLQLCHEAIALTVEVEQCCRRALELEDEDEYPGAQNMVAVSQVLQENEINS